MNSSEFETRVERILESLTKGGLLKEVHLKNFSGSEMAQMQINLAQIATQTALNLQELDLKKQDFGLQAERTRQELEMAIAREKLNNLKLASDAVASAVQAESIKRSVVDNAAINKTNAYVAYFNVIMNAVANNPNSLSPVITQTSQLVSTMIEKINTNPLAPNFDNVMDNLLKRVLDIKNLGLGNKQVAIIAPKTSITKGESVTLLGISVFNDNPCEFVLKNKSSEEIIKSNILDFMHEESGVHEIIFRVKNNEGAWIESKIKIRVLKHTPKIKKC